MEMCTAEELAVAFQCAPTKDGYKILQYIEFLYRGYSVQDTAEVFKISEKTVRNWMHRFNAKGLDGVVLKGKSGRPRKIAVDKFQAQYIPLLLEPSLAGEDNFTAVKFHFYLTEQCQEKLCYQTVLNYFSENKLSLVVARPCVVGKQNEEARQDFIEKFNQHLTNNKEIWFGDEVGFEGDPRPRARWVKLGSKPVAGRASEHLRFSAIGAVNPSSGELSALVVPEVDQFVFQAYLDQLKKDTQNRNIILVLDNASWHKVKTLNWHNIEPLFLPPYSPDLNPIENLWRYMKINYFSNWYAKNIEMLIERICLAFKSISGDRIKQTTNADYLIN